jgi:Putative transposase/Transposase zinc-binding domain
MIMGAITEIFKTFAPEYLLRFPDIPKQHKKVIAAIVNCRSGNLGVAVYRCEACGSTYHIDRSCGNRHCPQCQYHKTRDWLNNQLNRRLPGNYFMLTFTLPERLRFFCRANQRVAYGALFKAASGAIKKLALDSQHIGTDLPGFTGVLHTWGRQLQYHPHLHFIVVAGGLSKNRKKWLTSQNGFYLPVRALAKIFKAKFKAEMVKNAMLPQIDSDVWQTTWNVNCQAVGDAEASLKYLAPYVFRVAISDSRIVSVNSREITFSYRKSGSRRQRTLTIDALEFIRRFLQHVLPLGFMKVRHYGFMNSACKINLARLRLLIIDALGKISADFSDLVVKKAQSQRAKPFCHSCGSQLFYLFSIIPGVPYRGPT